MMKVITELTQQLTRYLLTQHVRAHRCIAVRPYTYRKYELTRCSAITEAALQGALFFLPKVEDWNWETMFYIYYRSIFNHCDISAYV